MIIVSQVILSLHTSRSTSPELGAIGERGTGALQGSCSPLWLPVSPKSGHGGPQLRSRRELVLSPQKIVEKYLCCPLVFFELIGSGLVKVHPCIGRIRTAPQLTRQRNQSIGSPLDQRLALFRRSHTRHPRHSTR